MLRERIQLKRNKKKKKRKWINRAYLRSYKKQMFFNQK